jgi:hypothetical protein
MLPSELFASNVESTIANSVFLGQFCVIGKVAMINRRV